MKLKKIMPLLYIALALLAAALIVAVGLENQRAEIILGTIACIMLPLCNYLDRKVDEEEGKEETL